MEYRTLRRVAVVILLVGAGCNSADSDGGVAVTAATIATTSSTVPITTSTTTTTMPTTTTRGVQRLLLGEALAAGMVEVEFRGTGSASGDIVTLAIRLVAATDDLVSLSVPAGMMLNNSAGGQQDLVIRGLTGVITGEFIYEPATEIELPDGEWREYLLEAYCAEAHDDNPSLDGLLTASESADEGLARVFAAIDELGVAVDVVVTQAAVWVITDDIRASELERVGYGLDEAGLAQAREIIESAGFDPAEFRLFG